MQRVHATGLNAWLDRLPRTRLGLAGRIVPTYRTMGLVGYYLALATGLAGGMIQGFSLLAVAGVATVGGLSFFLWAWARKAVTGREEIVLLEHVWFAYGWVIALLWLLEEPLLPYLDVFSVSLCPFLGMGRVGCLLAGCCHGRPSRIGITYGEEAARDGSPRHLIGVRLFPVQGLEALGLGVLWASGFATLIWGGAGSALVWFLVGYAVLRFGLEGLRGDGGPELFGISQARWMCIAQFGAALGLWEHLRGRPVLELHVAGSCGVFAALLAVALVLRRRWDRRRTLLSPDHMAELSKLLRAAEEEVREAGPAAATSSRGVVVAVSGEAEGGRERLHVSFSLPEPQLDLELLCGIAAGAVPAAEQAAVRYSPSGFLHLLVPGPLGREPRDEGRRRIARTLFGTAVRDLQSEPDPEREVASPAVRARDAGYFGSYAAKTGGGHGARR